MMFPKILLLFAFILIQLGCFAQTERYSFKDYSKESENHACLDNILFKADSVVFYEHDSTENKYSFLIYVAVKKIHERYLLPRPPRTNVRLILDVYLDTMVVEEFYKEVEATYDTIRERKNLKHFLPPSSSTDLEVNYVGFVKTKSSLIAYKNTSSTSCAS